MCAGMSEAVSSDIRQEANAALMEVDKGAPERLLLSAFWFYSTLARAAKERRNDNHAHSRV